MGKGEKGIKSEEVEKENRAEPTATPGGGADCIRRYAKVSQGRPRSAQSAGEQPKDSPPFKGLGSLTQ